MRRRLDVMDTVALKFLVLLARKSGAGVNLVQMIPLMADAGLSFSVQAKILSVSRMD